MEAWVSNYLLRVVGTATRSRSFVARFRSSQLIGLEFRGVPVEISGIDVRAAFTVQWMTQVAEIGASQGMYDYLRQVVHLGAGQQQYHMTVNTETWGEAVPIEEVPPQLLVPLDQQGLDIPGTKMTLGLVKNMPQGDPKDAPNLETLLLTEEINDDQPEHPGDDLGDVGESVRVSRPPARATETDVGVADAAKAVRDVRVA
jgi:hypothetical protein